MNESINTNNIRKDFPILDRVVNGKKLVYLDSANTSQKPTQVIDALVKYYQNYNSNVHRGIHILSQEATTAFENVREQVKEFIQANDASEIIFTANATAAINLVAYSWGRANISAGDEIVLSAMEHHSNLIPWQMLAAERGAKLVFIELTPDGQLDMESARKVIGPKTKLVAITQMSNVLGTINPIDKIAALAHAQGALILVDGAQGVPHLPTSVKNLKCDFLVFSVHKMLGPTGVGILWAKREILEAMPPFMGGGSMISWVKRESFAPNELPAKFEAGTPNIADVIATGAALAYLDKIGMKAVREHEIELSSHFLKLYDEFTKGSPAEKLVIYGPRDINVRGAVFAFNLGSVHPHDLGQILSDQNIAVRAGHHCCQPLMKDLGAQATARASFYIYNTKEEIDILFAALKEAGKVLVMSLADDLYRETILDHYHHPRNRGVIDDATAVIEGINPLCGDELTLYVQVDDGKIKDIKLNAKGCSINTASGSMMSEAVIGQSLEQATKTVETFKEMMLEKRKEEVTLPEGMEELEALQGVKKYPVRIKCVLLPWNSLMQAIKDVAADANGDSHAHIHSKVEMN